MTFRQYLLGRGFVVRTDHAALQWLRKTPEPMGQIARWLTFVEQYDFEVIHGAGSKHGNADGLSRRPVPHQDDLGLVEYGGMIRAVDVEQTAVDEGSSNLQDTVVSEVVSDSKDDRQDSSSVGGGNQEPSSILRIRQNNSKMIRRLVK